jgi:hypothetical protein
MVKRSAFIFLIVSIAFLLLIQFGIALTSAFAQTQETETTDPVDIGELSRTSLVAEGNLSSVGNNGEDYTGEVDWYIFTSAVDNTITVTLSFESGNDYDLYLYDANSSIPLDVSINDNPEILIHEVAASTSYLISVAGWEGAPGDYTLTLSPKDVEPPGPIDPVVLDFTDLTTEGSLSSVGNDGENYTGEVDWYIFTPTVTATTTITLSFERKNDYDLFLYDANGSIPLDASIHENPEILIYRVAASTPYLICVVGWKGSPGDYTLTLSPEDIEIPYEINLPKGWSMISLTVRPDSLRLSELFPGAGVVYSYSKEMGYVLVTDGEDLKIGKGYWILLNEARKYTIAGRLINEYTLPVYENGWDMIGGCTYLAHASVTNGRIAVIYSYVQGLGYQLIPELEDLKPGKGYWIMFNNVADQCEFKVVVPDS